MNTPYIPVVHWNTDDRPATWQLQRRNRLRVDIVDQFDARFLLTAIRGLSDEEGNKLKELMRDGTIPATPCGTAGFSGTCDTIFDHTGRPGDGWGWHVTNSATEFPALTKAAARDGLFKKMRIGNDFKDHVTKHPQDGYTVQFENVPWAVFKRYWRKPINLDRQFHGQKIKTSWRKNHGHMSWHPAVDNFHVDLDILRDYKHIFIDFNRTGNADAFPAMTKWMLKYAKAFRTMSDDMSPFVKGDAELLFTLEWMSRLPR